MATDGKSIEQFNTEPAIQAFIQDAWPQLAAIAWEHFMLEGRGAVYLDLQDAQLIAPGKADGEAYYVADGGLELARMHGWPSEAVVQAVHTYDPAREVLIIVRQPDGKSVYYVVTGDPIAGRSNPPEAFLARALTPPVDASGN